MSTSDIDLPATTVGTESAGTEPKAIGKRWRTPRAPAADRRQLLLLLDFN